MAAQAAVTETSGGLRRDAIGLREVLFQSITDMAPGAAIAASIPAGVAFAGGVAAAGGDLRTGRGLVLRLQHWPAGPRDAVVRFAGHVRGPGPAPGRRLPGGVGICACGPADPPAGPAPARVHHRRHAQLGVPRLPGQPVVAVGHRGRADRAGRRPLRCPDLGPARHGARAVRDRRLPRPGNLPYRARRQSQHALCFHY